MTARSGANKLCLVDVGGAGGLQPKWYPFADKILPVLFEPNPVQAANLRHDISNRFSEYSVLEVALAHVDEKKALNLTRFWGCTSLLAPNADILSQYRIASAFDVVGSATIECRRYDGLFQAGLAPAPDALKIDVQGYEYEVLQGFGGLLQGCLGIELESHVYEIYHGQKLLHDLIALLAGFGFVLRKIQPVPSFDGNVVELDAWFTKNVNAWRALSEADKGKFSLLCDVWELMDYSRVDPRLPHDEFFPV